MKSFVEFMLKAIRMMLYLPKPVGVTEFLSGGRRTAATGSTAS